MADYLLEVGCEEIPARMVDRGVRDLEEALVTRLRGEGLAPSGPSETYGGPRRLAVLLRGIPDRQPDASERIVGPPAERAFDAEGKPTKAATSFAQKLGIDVTRLERVETPKGVCIAGTKETKGEEARAVLARVVPEAVLAMSFAKTMRWGSRDTRFVRAIRSLVSLLDEEVVELEIAGVRSGRATFGHRFLGARSVPLAATGDYVAALLREHVVVVSETRRRAIEAQVEELGKQSGGKADLDPDLLAEVVHLVEEPHVVAGRFDPAYLELPSEILVTSIQHHQKGFPVWAEPGKRLAPAMLAVANIPDTKGHVARGSARVLNARLADARFFWQEDRKLPLAERLPKLEKVVFHEKLGSYAAKTRRLEKLAPRVAEACAFDAPVAAAAAAAARLCKVNLVTGMVGEFAELQGIVGGLYLQAEGASEAVHRAVYEHYRPVSLEGELPATPAGSALAIADKIDTLVGFFGAGLIPSGTKDPFGLRRAAQGVVRIVLAAGRRLPLGPLLDAAIELHRLHPGIALDLGDIEVKHRIQRLHAYLRDRIDWTLRAEFTARNAGTLYYPSEIDAVLEVDALDFVGARERWLSLEQARKEPWFAATAAVLKRIANIAGRDGNSDFDAGRLRLPEEQALAGRLGSVLDRVASARASFDHAAALRAVSELAAPLDEFFTKVLVMDPDLEVRENRLRLLRAIAQLVAPIGDFSKLQVEREGKAHE